MLNCQQVTQMASDFIERRLRLRERLMVIVHIAMCRGCRIYIAQFRATLLAMRAVPTPAPAEPTNALLEHFSEQTRPPDP